MTASLIEQFRRVYAFKSPDVEEWVDMVWHRPLAAVVALTLLPTPIGPNLVTVASLIVGLAGSAALAWSIATTEASWRILAATLIFASVILDCADGQLARAKGGGSRWGRILDGLVDAIVVLTLYIVMFVDVVLHFGWVWGAVTFAAGISAGLQIYIYDKLKSIYLSFVQPSASDGGESLQNAEREWAAVKADGTLRQKVGMFIYVRMLLSAQEAIVPAPQVVPDLDRDAARRFRDQHIAAVRLFTLLGLGTHMLFIYAAVGLSAWFPSAIVVLQLLFLVPYNLLFVYVLWRNTPMRHGELR